MSEGICGLLGCAVVEGRRDAVCLCDVMEH